MTALIRFMILFSPLVLLCMSMFLTPTCVKSELTSICLDLERIIEVVTFLFRIEILAKGKLFYMDELMSDGQKGYAHVQSAINRDRVLILVNVRCHQSLKALVPFKVLDHFEVDRDLRIGLGSQLLERKDRQGFEQIRLLVVERFFEIDFEHKF